jgi:biotin operon repressor
VRIQNPEALDPLAAKIVSFLQVQGGESGRGIGRVLHSSRNETWVTLKKLEKLAWVERRDGKYYLTDGAGKVNIYDPKAALLFAEAGRRLLIAIRDYGPLSSREAGLLTGVSKGATARQIQKLKRAGVVAAAKAGSWAAPSAVLVDVSPLSLWPSSEERLADFVAATKANSSLVTLVLFGYPALNIAAVTNELDAKPVYQFGEQIADSLDSCRLRPRTLLIASRHAWLYELHRIHYPPALMLRSALLGAPVYGEKPRHDYTALYEMGSRYAPLTETDIERWTSKRWLTRTADGKLAYSPVGVEITRKLRQATKVFQETITSRSGIDMQIYFA